MYLRKRGAGKDPENLKIRRSGDLIRTQHHRNKRSKADFTVGNIYFSFTNISEGTAFLLQGLTYNDKIKLRRYNLK